MWLRYHSQFSTVCPARKPASLRKIKEIKETPLPPWNSVVTLNNAPLPEFYPENLTADFEELHDILNELSKETVDLLNK